MAMQKMSFSLGVKDYLELIPPDCTHSVIFSADGTIWAISEGWTFTADDAKMLSTLMENPVAASKAKFKLGQRTYLVVYADATSLASRKREFGVMIARAKMYYVLAFCDGTVDPGRCFKSVRRVAELMKTNARQPHEK